MADKLSPEQRSKNMGKIRSKGTSPETAVRKLTHRLGFRFRLHRKDLPGKPDLVFPGKKKVILVHGCFWHQHDDPACKIARIPKSKTDYWIPKLQGNVERDKQHLHALEDMGWQVLILWECETKELEALEKRITGFLSGRGNDREKKEGP